MSGRLVPSLLNDVCIMPARDWSAPPFGVSDFALPAGSYCSATSPTPLLLGPEADALLRLFSA